MVFCPRTVKEQAKKIGYTNELERAGCEILSDCCTCLTPLINKDDVDAVTTNSIKGAFYLKNSTGVDVNLKSLLQLLKMRQNEKNSCVRKSARYCFKI